MRHDGRKKIENQKKDLKKIAASFGSESESRWEQMKGRRKVYHLQPRGPNRADLRKSECSNICTVVHGKKDAGKNI